MPEHQKSVCRGKSCCGFQSWCVSGDQSHCHCWLCYVHCYCCSHGRQSGGGSVQMYEERSAGRGCWSCSPRCVHCSVCCCRHCARQSAAAWTVWRSTRALSAAPAVPVRSESSASPSLASHEAEAETRASGDGQERWAGRGSSHEPPCR